MKNDPDFTPAYEQWKVDWNYALMAIFSLPFVYLLAAIAAVVAAFFPSSRK